MFCPVGYVTLARLWEEFFAKYRIQLTRLAFEKFGESDFELGETFGSPDDYCEDVFLSTLADFPIFAATADGRVTLLETISDQGRSRLFAKMSPFESFLAAGDPAEAGEEGYWLRRFGSDHFQAWDVTRKTLSDWKAFFGGVDGRPAKQPSFHTLPFAFERGRYVVPEAAPPWICDVIDEHYLPRMIASFSGQALCMEESTSSKWRVEVLNAPKPPQLGDGTQQDAQRMGRPSKVGTIAEVYERMYPDGHRATWKELSKTLQKETSLSFSVKTLQRAVSMVTKSETTPED